MTKTERRAQALREIAARLREQGDEVARLYGSPEPPQGEMRPADRLWWTTRDAAQELDHMADALDAIESRRAARESGEPR